MKHNDFEIGTEFWTGSQRWRCTDVGTRTIVAIELNDRLEEPWFRGPPYAVHERLFDEIDFVGTYRSQEEAFRKVPVEGESSAHPEIPWEVKNAKSDYEMSAEHELYADHADNALLRVARVSATGEILHPYAATQGPDVWPKTGSDPWRIRVHELFTGAYGEIPDAEFVRLRPATEADFRARRDAIAGADSSGAGE